MSAMRLAAVSLLLLSSAASAQTIYTWTDTDGTVHYTDNLSTVPQGVKVDTTEGADLAMVNTREDKEVGAVVARPEEQAPPPRVARSAYLITSAVNGEPLDEYQWRSRFRSAHAEVQTLEDELAIDKKRLSEPSGYGMLCGGGPVLQPAVVPYRPLSQQAAMQARATIRPAPGVAITGEATVQQNTVVAQPPAGVAYPQPYSGYGSCIATPSPEYDRLKDRVERNTAALKRAKDALDDLDRQASHHGVPREWRRP